MDEGRELVISFVDGLQIRKPPVVNMTKVLRSMSAACKSHIHNLIQACQPCMDHADFADISLMTMVLIVLMP